jgi:hypothetical protein
MDTDRNLLFGVLALQADLLDAARFAEECALALAAGAAGKDDSLTPAERQKLAGQYAARALELLKRADGAGLFRDRERLRQLRTAQELAPLHSRDDFRRWLSGLLRRPQK